MMRVIDVPPNAIPHRAANQDIRQVMLLPGEASEADGAGNSVSGNLHQTTIMVFVGYHRSQGPGLDTVAGRKGGSAVKKIAPTLTGQWATTLGDFLERSYDNRAINQGFSAE